MKKRYVAHYRVETNGGRIIAHCETVEAAEHQAAKGRGRWIFKWVDGRYCCAGQYN